MGVPGSPTAAPTPSSSFCTHPNIVTPGSSNASRAAPRAEGGTAHPGAGVAVVTPDSAPLPGPGTHVQWGVQSKAGECAGQQGWEWESPPYVRYHQRHLTPTPLSSGSTLGSSHPVIPPTSAYGRQVAQEAHVMSRRVGAKILAREVTSAAEGLIRSLSLVQ